MANIDGLTTETINETTKSTNKLDLLGIVTLINNEDKKMALAVEKELPSITRVVNEIAVRFKRGGRTIYRGTGFLGRMETLDAMEPTSTYSVSPDRASGLLAGGETAMYKAVEGVEDSKELALEDLRGVQITKNGCIIDIAANGCTPCIISALECANEVGVLSISTTCNGGNEMTRIAGISIASAAGTGAINGFTRVKAGTAQKMIVNVLSTVTTICLGEVYHNYMVQVQSTNGKLVVRAIKMIAQTTGVEEDKALMAFELAGLSVPEVIIMPEGSCGRETAKKALNQADGQVRKVIEIIKK